MGDRFVLALLGTTFMGWVVYRGPDHLIGNLFGFAVGVAAAYGVNWWQQRKAGQ